MTMSETASSWVLLGQFPELDLDVLLDNLDPEELLPVLMHDGAPPVGWVDEIMLDADGLVARVTPVGPELAAAGYELSLLEGVDSETGVDIGPELRALVLVPPLQEPQDGPQSPEDGHLGARTARAPLDPAVASLLAIFPHLTPAEAQHRLDQTANYLDTKTQTLEKTMNNTAASLPTEHQMTLARQEARRTGRPYAEVLQAVRLQATRDALQLARTSQPTIAPIPSRAPATAPRPSAPVTATKRNTTVSEARVQLSAAMPGFAKLDIDAQQHAARTFMAKGKVDLDCYPGATKRVRANAYLAATTVGWDKLHRDDQWAMVQRLVSGQVPA